MGYISKEDKKFVTVMSKKYQKYGISFEYFDDYVLWLFYHFCNSNEDFYYRQLEKDIWEYSNFQTGSNRHDLGRWKYGAE